MKRVWIYRVIPGDGSAEFYELRQRLPRKEGGKVVTDANHQLLPLAGMLKNILQTEEEETWIGFRSPFDARIGTTGELAARYEALDEREQKQFLTALR